MQFHSICPSDLDEFPSLEKLICSKCLGNKFLFQYIPRSMRAIGNEVEYSLGHSAVEFACEAMLITCENCNFKINTKTADILVYENNPFSQRVEEN